MVVDPAYTVKLSQSLVEVLQESTLTIDDATRKNLLLTSAEIRSALSKSSTELSSTTDEKKSADSPGGQLLPPEADAGSVGRAKQKQRRQKILMMVAQRPFLELTREQSSLSVMEWLTGRRFYERYWKYKSWMKMFSLAGFIMMVIVVPIYTAGSLTEQQRLIMLILCIPATLFGLTHAAALSIGWVLRQALFKFEAVYLLVETFLFFVSLSGLYCFTVSAICFAAIGFLSTLSGVVVYDSIPVSIRQRLIGSLIVWCLMCLLVIALILLHVSDSMCYHRLDFKYGLIEDGDPRQTKLGIGLLGFCANRGFTMLSLMVRTTYLAFIHPSDCVLIRTRIRILELPVDDRAVLSEAKDDSVSAENQQSRVSMLCESLAANLRQKTVLDELSKSYLLRTRVIIEQRLSSSSAMIRVKSRGSSYRMNQRSLVIMGVRPYVELTRQQSSLTVMEWLLGRRFYRGWWTLMRFIAPLTLASFFLIVILVPVCMMLPTADMKVGILLPIGCLPGLLLGHLGSASLAKWCLLKKTLSTFEARLFLVESALFAISLSVVLDFSPTGYATSSIIFGLLCGVPYYDSSPTRVRRRVRSILGSYCVSFTLILIIIHFRLSPNIRAYRWDPMRGFMVQASLQPHNRNDKTALSLSVIDFCLNRGITALTLVARATYLAFRYPADCVFLTNRLRIVEETSASRHQSLKSWWSTSTSKDARAKNSKEIMDP